MQDARIPGATRRHSHHHRLHLTSLLLGVQCFNTVVASTVYYFFADTFEPMRHSWYALRAMGSRPKPPHPTHVSHDPLLSRSKGTPSARG